jgi:hypothetical protein
MVAKMVARLTPGRRVSRLARADPSLQLAAAAALLRASGRVAGAPEAPPSLSPCFSCWRCSWLRPRPGRVAAGESSSDPGRGDDNAAPGNGAAYVFQDAGAWSQIAYLEAPVPAVNDAFGTRVALAAGVLAVGAPFGTAA